MTKELVPYNDLERMAVAITKSGLFGINKPDQAVALLLIAQAEGMHPAAAARDYHIIQGKPALKADAMLARFQQSGGKIQWDELTDNRVAATFSHPAGGTVMIDWTMDRAKKAGLGGKGMWAKYPRQMLRARVVSEGIRTVFPGVSVGIYTPEEVSDFDDVVDVVVEETPPEYPVDKLIEGVEYFLENKLTPEKLDKWLEEKESSIQLLDERQKRQLDNAVKETKVFMAGGQTSKPSTLDCPNGFTVTLIDCEECPQAKECEKYTEATK